MSDWFARLQEEYGQLLGRLDKLNSFIDYPLTWTAVTAEQWSLLIAQRDAMTTYAEILRKRIQLEISNRESKEATPDHRD